MPKGFLVLFFLLSVSVPLIVSAGPKGSVVVDNDLFSAVLKNGRSIACTRSRRGAIVAGIIILKKEKKRFISYRSRWRSIRSKFGLRSKQARRAKRRTKKRNAICRNSDLGDGSGNDPGGDDPGGNNPFNPPPDPTPTPSPQPPSNPGLCGDGVLYAGEQCDDGNLISLDGCSEVCRIESGWVCQGIPSTCYQYTNGLIAEAIAVWAYSDGNTVSGVEPIGVVAYHHQGISRVEFSIDGLLYKSVNDETMNPRTNEMEFVFNLDTTLLSDDQFHLIDAVAYPNDPNGTPHILPSRTIYVNNTPTEYRSWYVDGVTGDDTASGTINDPFRTIMRALLAAQSGDNILLVPSFDYDLDVSTNRGFDQYVTIKSADPAVMARITSFSSGTLRSSFLAFENLEFDWSNAPADLPDGGMSGPIIGGWTGDHFKFKGCVFHARANSYNNYKNAIQAWGSMTSVTIENCQAFDLDRFALLPGDSIVRRNTVGPITSDFYDFGGKNSLASGNTVFGIAAPNLYIISNAVEPYDLSVNKSLTIYLDDLNSGTYQQFNFPDLGANSQNKSAVSVQEIANLLNSNPEFSSPLKLKAIPLNGKLKIEAQRTNYTQHLYVTGSANIELEFPNISVSTEAVGSGQHADAFQSWTYTENFIGRNNKIFNNTSQYILMQNDSKNIAFINNEWAALSTAPWAWMFSAYTHTNHLYEFNTLYGSNNAVVFPTSGFLVQDAFVMRNNIFGTRAGASDINTQTQLMDYNVYDYYILSPELGPNSINVNTEGVTPSPADLFENVTPTFNPSTSLWDYTGDFSLSVDSLARDRASSASNIRYDLHWQPRNDGNPDVGAYER